jgi:hypothetical protein
MKLKKLIQKINKENTPPGGWRPEDKVQASSTRQFRMILKCKKKN